MINVTLGKELEFKTQWQWQWQWQWENTPGGDQRGEGVDIVPGYCGHQPSSSGPVGCGRSVVLFNAEKPLAVLIIEGLSGRRHFGNVQRTCSFSTATYTAIYNELFLIYVSIECPKIIGGRKTLGKGK